MFLIGCSKFSGNQKHYSDLCSDASSLLLNFCSHSSDVIFTGKVQVMVQLWMSAAFSGYMHFIWCKIQCKNFLGWSSFIRAAKSAKWVWIHSVCCCCSSSNIYAGMALPLFYILYLSGHFLLFNRAICTILLLWNPVFLWMPDCYFHTNLVYWQVLVVFYFVELLQRGYLAKRQLLGETVSLWQRV